MALIDKEKLIGFECMSDWPIYKMNLREILLELGGKLVDNQIIFNNNDPTLNVYPVRVIDDGSGYGTDKEFFESITVIKNESVVMFTRKKDDNLQQKVLELENLSKKIIDENSR